MLSLFRDRAVLSPHLCCVCICVSGSIRHLWFSCTATRIEEASDMEVAATTEQEHSVSTGSTSTGVKGRPTKKAKRQFDFSRYNKRHVALKVAYLGWNYHGFAVQDDVETVEGQLFASLMKTKLIEDPQSCSYARCGRTDVGVSALGQVVSLYMRSNLHEGLGVVMPVGSKAQEKKGDSSQELPYIQMLNAVLPDDIRVLSWAPVQHSFSARFSCLQRVYKYYFPQGNMDLEFMSQAAQKFVGEHDFRNFCKMDIAGGVTNFQRRLLSVGINPVEDSPSAPNKMFELTVSGNAFLWHQIRCMVSVLFLIGNRLEKPELIDHMLNVEKCLEKPQYGMASGLPLILYKTVFEDVSWQDDTRSYSHVVTHFQKLWTLQMCRSSMLLGMSRALELPLTLSSSTHLSCAHVAPLLKGDHKLGTSSYKPLLSRPTSQSFEDRLQYHMSKRTKLKDSAI